jgi:hypothetical protein
MEEWASEVDDPRLVVIDTLGKAEPQLDDAQNRYLAEQAMMLKYKKFADRHDCTVLFIHHNNKAMDNGDWLDRMSGSKGITGGADTLLYIDFKRGERTGFLRIEGRDVEADDVPIFKPRGRPFWLAESAPDSLGGTTALQDARWEPSALQRAILALVEGNEGLPYSTISAAFPGQNIAEDFGQLIRVGKLERTGPEGSLIRAAAE